jgi:hypothetical protein
MKTCIVVFPLYGTPSEIELAFLENGLNLTQGFKQVIVAPEGLIIDQSFGLLEKLEVKRFAKHYFDGIRGYNQLLLSKVFYRAFALYDYLLIHQADVYLFKNELSFWCEKGYDYIGAPWFRPNLLNQSKWKQTLHNIKFFFKKNKVYASRHNKVGNGGLTLRKVSSSIEILEQIDPGLLKKYTDMDGDGYNEDIFWSLEAPQVMPFQIPTWEEALHFAIEFNPTVAYQYNNAQLPFGCHAPMKHAPEFWKAFIPVLNLQNS